ncbi:MAG: hypothetical protein D0530_11195 [Methylococcales bacterium]|nr:MAG: hypothetical protein D0530_11195 [Methylococcales bacterium]
MKTSIFTNPRNITFLDTANKDLASDGFTILDPWKHAYQIAVDATYAGSIANPLGGTPATIASSVIVWSWGPGGVVGTSDDVTSW